MSKPKNKLLQIKSCVVVLERLDEKLLSQYLEKYDPNASKMVDIVKITDKQSNCSEKYSNDLSSSVKNSEGSTREKSKMSKKLTVKNKFKARKRKIRPSGFSDEEYSTEKKSFSEKTKSSEKEKEQTGNNRVISEKVNKSEIEFKISESLAKRKQSLCDVINLNSEKTDRTKYADSEIKFTQEITKSNDLTEKENLSGSTTRIDEQDCEDDVDLREDNEDDRLTVIFDKSFYTEEVFELEKREVECPAKKFKNGDSKVELTNIKENLFIKPYILSVESKSKESEKNESVKECYLKNLCVLVKRLHESGRIISQLKKELPKNEELAVHFYKVIRIQTENFVKEIKNNQKTVIECYEKLLFFYGSVNEVVSEISKHAFLKVEEVSKIISQCFLLREVCDLEQNITFPENLNSFRQPQTSDSSLRVVNENLRKLLSRNKVCKADHLKSQSHYFSPLECRSCQFELLQRPANEPVISCMLPARKNAVNHTSDPGLRSYLPPCSDYRTWNQQEPQVWTQQRNQNQFVDPRLMQQSQHELNLRCSGLVSYYSDALLYNNQPSNMKAQSHPHNTSSISSAVSLFRQKRPEPSAPRHSLNVYPCCFPNYVQQTAAPQSIRSNYATPNVQNISTCVAVQLRNNLPRGSFAFPSNIPVDDQRHALTFPGGVQNSSGSYLNHSQRFANQIPSELLVSEEACSSKNKSRTNFKNSSRMVVPEVLDPTVPQKLTMKNYRLQAEPTLEVTEGKILEPEDKLNSFKSSEEANGCSWLKEKASNSRVYICAQNGCKMPGLRICKGCQSVIYCSETCQLKHWALKHKTECYQLRELRLG